MILSHFILTFLCLYSYEYNQNLIRGTPIANDEQSENGEHKRFVFATPEEKRKWEDGLVDDLNKFFERRANKRKKEITDEQNIESGIGASCHPIGNGSMPVPTYDPTKPYPGSVLNWCLKLLHFETNQFEELNDLDKGQVIGCIDEVFDDIRAAIFKSQQERSENSGEFGRRFKRDGEGEIGAEGPSAAIVDGTTPRINPSYNKGYEELDKSLSNYCVKKIYGTKKLFHELHDHEQGVVLGCINEMFDCVVNPLRILQLRNALERQINKLYGGEKPSAKSYMQALEDALTSKSDQFRTDPTIMAFCEMIHENEQTVADFLTAAKSLYSDLSKEVHNIKSNSITAPQFNETDLIKSILLRANIEVTPESIKTLSLVMKPKDLPGKIIGSNIVDGELCIIILPRIKDEWRLFDPKNKRGISKEDVQYMFPRVNGKPSHVKWVKREKDKTGYYIQVEFENQDTFKIALHNVGNILQGDIFVEIKPSMCFDELHDKDRFADMVEKSEKTNKSD